MRWAMDDAIVSKITKLLQLAGNNSSEAEADAALTKAHQLLAEHNLSLDDVKPQQQNKAEVFEEIITEDQQLSSGLWRRNLAFSVADLHFCKMLAVAAQNKVIWIGTKTNITVGKSIFAYLQNTIIRLAKREITWNLAAASTAEKTRWKSQFCEGCVLRLRSRISALLAETKNDTLTISARGNTLPAILDQNEKRIDSFMAVKFTNIRQGRRRVHRSSDALNAGYKAGGEISLNRQIES